MDASTKDIERKLRNEWTDRFIAVIGASNIDFNHINFDGFVTIDTVLKYENKPWCWDNLAEYAHITFDDVLKYPKLQKWYRLSRNKNIMTEQFFEHSSHSWDWDYIFTIREIPMKIIEKYETKINWYSFSKNHYLTADVILKYKNKPWDWVLLSKNDACISSGIISKYPDWSWYWNKMHENHNITLEFVEQHRNKNWNWKGLSKRFFWTNCKTSIEHTQTNLSMLTMCEYYQTTDNYAKCIETICAKDMVISNEYLVKCILQY